MTFANILRRDGVVVIPQTFFSKNVVKYRNDFVKECEDFPEFVPGTTQFVLGGFAALGNPASFHNPVVRRFREWAMVDLIELLFREFVPPNRELEQIIDRMMIRLKGESPSKEAWHRDEAKLAKADDITLGGWLNLDPTPQYFSCVKQSHITARGTGGFAKIDKKEHQQMKNASQMIEIPPGAYIVFYEHIVHEVVGRKARSDIVRLFLGWRITQERQSMIPHLNNLLRTQAVIPLKSGQDPPMYAKLHWTNHSEKLVKWTADSVIDACKVNRTFAGGKRKGQKCRIVESPMRSLQEYGLPLYPGYSSSEKKMYRPNRSWKLLMPGRTKLRKIVLL